VHLRCLWSGGAVVGDPAARTKPVSVYGVWAVVLSVNWSAASRAVEALDVAVPPLLSSWKVPCAVTWQGATDQLTSPVLIELAAPAFRASEYVQPPLSPAAFTGKEPAGRA
jgi:hypothetical protein